MPRYAVQWGDDTATVVANNPQDAWAVFADGNDVAKSLPKSRKLVVTEVVPVVQTVRPTVKPTVKK